MDAVERVHAAVDMEGAARRVVHTLKYRGVESVAAVMSRSIVPLTEAHPVDVLFAVPLHRSRQRQRGFNQSELLLRGLTNERPEGRLVRTRNTSRQVGMHLGERRSNISGAFDYSGPGLGGKTAGVLDDVVTTGSTANECARVLRDHGARHVLVFAYARANYNPAAPHGLLFD
ncbi:MAG: ComF family protein [Tepidiformaceae bacterium]